MTTWCSWDRRRSLASISIVTTMTKSASSAPSSVRRRKRRKGNASSLPLRPMLIPMWRRLSKSPARPSLPLRPRRAMRLLVTHSPLESKLAKVQLMRFVQCANAANQTTSSLRPKPWRKLPLLAKKLRRMRKSEQGGTPYSLILALWGSVPTMCGKYISKSKPI